MYGKQMRVSVTASWNLSASFANPDAPPSGYVAPDQLPRYPQSLTEIMAGRRAVRVLVAGVATCTLEILEARPDVEAIVVPVGGGSGASGACIVAKAVRPSIEVIGVQSEAAPAAYRSWRAGAPVQDSTSTFAEGLATRTAFELPQQIMRDLLDDFVLVSEATLRDATRLMIEKTRNLVEPAGAAALAAVLTAPDQFKGRNVALICSGGNISPAQLAALLA